MTTDVWFVMLPGVLALDMTGPAETFSLAGEAFRLHYIGPDAEVPTSIGLTMGNIAPLPDSLPEGSLLVLPGVHQSARYFATPQADTVRHWLMRMQPLIHSQKVLLMCVCSGSLLAAKAGLMTGIQCTTHHDVIARLRAAAPAALVKENRIFIEDRGIWTSAGITSGIDLTLHIIHRLCGPETALAVAREMVVWFRRSGDDPQLSPWLRYRNHLHPAVHRAQDVLTAEPQKPWQLADIAEQAHVSPRHLTRLFQQHLGISVRDYLEQLRLAVAEQWLLQGRGTEQAAMAAGFSSPRQLHRARQRAAG
ncbi:MULTISPECIES: GlxA family transcriptional regulator [Enterobacteriaceae]|jgi:transcriptional regulator GlxA family with amidase domain|uniref:GlxA family transcriptional regulator n=2 Tax=Enterobacteriaceae TaxID=543 RepID=A0ABW1Q7H7_9ENTR|nr:MULTISPECIES: helix-turn-helix domain-containing protein [Phytobacter]AUU88272.1 AraC family transcriptional regulator [Enterobacteriaceae bacterium ENNIH3]AUV06436.1 AraC family transcriptional regulator [Enterobacteriaceae bacterium ENNIH2]MDU4153133.1 helix-turn-helix domain-containing protein [Enterobacteriaceae bacterium]PWF53094.1 AraC family transcriptional regulator [[Kluyvera] intestini]MDU4995355.1 helix-turn-helix domain-containing protein [Enterobacteriaceae bacterium]